MIRIFHEAFYTGINVLTRKGSRRYIEIFKNPTWKEMRDIEMYPDLRYIQNKDGDFLVFSGLVLHGDVVREIGIEDTLTTGLLDVENKKILKYEPGKVNSVTQSAYAKAMFNGWGVYDAMIHHIKLGTVGE